MVKQTTVSFESKYLRMLNNIAKSMVEADFGFENKLDESYLADVLSSKSISDTKKISVSINDDGAQLIFFGQEACDFNNITYSSFKNIFTGIVIKDLNIEKYLRKESVCGKIYTHKFSKVIGKTLLDELSNLDSNNDFTNHQTLSLFENLTPGIALLIYVNLIKIGSRYDNYNDIDDGISEDDIYEGIYRDLKLCKFLFEDLKEYFSEDVFTERIASAISEYISDEKETYLNINYFCIEGFDDKFSGTKNVFETIINYFGKNIFVEAIKKLLKDEQSNLKNNDYDYLLKSELKSQFFFAKTILKLLKDNELNKSQKEILLEELLLIFFDKDEHSAYILRNKWSELFDISKERSSFSYYLDDFKKNFRETFCDLLDYLKKNGVSDKVLIINAPTYTGEDFDIAHVDEVVDGEKFYPFVKNFLYFFDFVIKLIVESEAENFINIMTSVYNDEFITIREEEDTSLLFKTKEYRDFLNFSLNIFSEISDRFDEGSKQVVNNIINSIIYRLSQIDSK
jgi:hypothetical protein